MAVIYGPLTPGQVCRCYSFLPHFEGNSLLSLRVRCNTGSCTMSLDYYYYYYSEFSWRISKCVSL